MAIKGAQIWVNNVQLPYSGEYVHYFNARYPDGRRITSPIQEGCSTRPRAIEWFRRMKEFEKELKTFREHKDKMETITTYGWPPPIFPSDWEFPLRKESHDSNPLPEPPDSEGSSPSPERNGVHG